MSPEVQLALDQLRRGNEELRRQYEEQRAEPAVDAGGGFHPFGGVGEAVPSGLPPLPASPPAVPPPATVPGDVDALYRAAHGGVGPQQAPADEPALAQPQQEQQGAGAARYRRACHAAGGQDAVWRNWRGVPEQTRGGAPASGRRSVPGNDNEALPRECSACWRPMASWGNARSQLQDRVPSVRTWSAWQHRPRSAADRPGARGSKPP